MHYARLVLIAVVILCATPLYFAFWVLCDFVFFSPLGATHIEQFIEREFVYIVLNYCVRLPGLILVALISLYETGWPLERTIALAALAPV